MLVGTDQAFSKTFLKINPSLRVVGDDQIRKDREVSIPMLQESSFPVRQPRALSLEKHIVGLKQVVVTRHHVRVVTRVNRRYLRVPSEKFRAFAFWEELRCLEPLDESAET